MSNVCATCSDDGNDCCHAKGPDRVGITLADTYRISEATGLKPNQYSELVRLPARQRRAVHMQYPGADRWFTDGHRLSLKIDAKSRACVFWKKSSGCQLGGAKPRICAVWPAWYVRSRNHVEVNWAAFAPEGRCAAVTMANGSSVRLLKILGSSKDAALETMREMDKDLDSHAKLSLAELRDRLGMGDQRPTYKRWSSQ